MRKKKGNRKKSGKWWNRTEPVKLPFIEYKTMYQNINLVPVDIETNDFITIDEWKDTITLEQFKRQNESLEL